ncbi:NAD(P)/FAD-dependent oxidoreductase [Mesomycoplasma conjunctivae]|uniref:NAD(P)/FAD-dependent oxidoreductase n=1 Tax=Mesomycoplasma conjunctivae TaxID=45361 RepID=UPI003DA54C03
MKTIYDVIIIGAGPAGLTTALYASRGNLKVLILEKLAPGGKLVSQSKIENWPGDESIGGADLAVRMYKHALKFGTTHLYGDVTKVESKGEFEHLVYTSDEKVYYAKSVVVATGMVERKPADIKNYFDFEGRGVSYCVVCDGPFYKGKPSVIIGGGNSAVEEGTFLASIASEVHILVRDAQFIAEPMLVDELMTKENVKVYFETKALELKGEDELQEIVVEQKGEVFSIPTASLFPYIGFLPATKFLESQKHILNSQGFLIVDKFKETAQKGIYGVGDVVAKDIRQIVTAANDGAIVGKILTNRIK